MKEISFGIIGAGGITQILSPAFTNYPGIKVAAVADTNESAARDVANKFNHSIEVFPDFRTLLHSPAVDAVYIATPPFLHKAMILESLTAGKHVLCEKPLLMSLEEIREVEAAAQLHPQLKLAGCSSRFHAAPPVRRARELLATGALGKLLRVRLQNSLKPATPLDSLPGWKQKRATSGGGVTMDWGVYDLDWLQFLLGPAFTPVEILARTTHWGREGSDVETGFSAELLCASGLSISWERSPEHGPQFQRAEIRGTEGGLDLPFISGGKPEALLRHRYDESRNLQSEILSEPITDWDAIMHYPILDFAGAIRDDRPVASPLATQFNIQAVIEALYESARIGKSVSLLLR